MGKFDDKSGHTTPTRLLKTTATRKLETETDAAGDVTFDREQLKEMGKLDTAPPPTIFDPKQGAAAPSAENTAQDAARQGNRTVVYRPKKRGAQASSAAAEARPVPVTAPDDESTVAETDSPVVAWLVVLEGAGRGQAIAMSYGLNKIGRNADQEISLDFGDREISREHHAVIEYDPRERTFHLSKGENLVYLNDERVGLGSERAIKMGDLIGIGKTVLKFVPLCGADFDWSD